MTEKIIIAGAGGQGIMLLGKVLAAGAMKEGKFVIWFPAYGAEVRGGTAHCRVIISDQEIASPYIDKADTLIVMNNPSLAKFKDRTKHNSLFIINSSLAGAAENDKRYVKHPFTGIALKLGNVKVANMIALGCYLAHKKIISPETILKVIRDIAPRDKKGLIPINQAAFKKGYGLRGEKW